MEETTLIKDYITKVEAGKCSAKGDQTYRDLSDSYWNYYWNDPFTCKGVYIRKL